MESTPQNSRDGYAHVPCKQMASIIILKRTAEVTILWCRDRAVTLGSTDNLDKTPQPLTLAIV